MSNPFFDVLDDMKGEEVTARTREKEYTGEVYMWQYDHLGLLLRDVEDSEGNRIPFMMIRGSNLEAVEFPKDPKMEEIKEDLQKIKNKMEEDLEYKAEIVEGKVVVEVLSNQFKVDHTGEIIEEEGDQSYAREIRKALKDLGI